MNPSATKKWKNDLIAATFLMATSTLAQLPLAKGAAPAKDSIGERAAPDRVIVKFKSDARTSAREMALSRARVRVRKTMRSSGVSVLEVVEKGKPIKEVIQSLEESGLVEYAEPDFIFHIDFLMHGKGDQWKETKGEGKPAEDAAEPTSPPVTPEETKDGYRPEEKPPVPSSW